MNIPRTAGFMYIGLALVLLSLVVLHHTAVWQLLLAMLGALLLMSTGAVMTMLGGDDR